MIDVDYYLDKFGKPYILADKEIDLIYSNKYVENKDVNNKMSNKYTKE